MKTRRRPLLWLLTALCLALCACQAVPEETAADGPEGELAFPGTRWDMTPEELTGQLGLEDYETQTLQEEDDTTGAMVETYLIGVEGYELFGATARVTFQFFDFTGEGRFGLGYITVFYDGDLDAAAVRAAMEEAYGAPAESDSHMAGWASRTKRVDLLGEDAFQAVNEAEAETLQEQSVTTVLFSDGTEDLLTWPEVYGPGIAFTSSLTAIRSRERAG